MPVHTQSPQKLRALEEAKKRRLRPAVTKIYVAIGLMVDEKILLDWMGRSTGFVAFLRLVAKQHFGEREEVSLWEQGLCQILSDLALNEMTLVEKKTREIFTPKEILLWFADFLERLFSKPDLRWDSALFSMQVVSPLMQDILARTAHLTETGTT